MIHTNKHVFDINSSNHLIQPMFLGESVSVSRYDDMRIPYFDRLTERQLGFFWRPNEIDISRDRDDFNNKLEEYEKHIFVSNLKYQTLLDSVQGRSPNLAFLPIVSLPELETWIETWSFSESIHSRSYTHIIRNIFSDPSIVLDDILKNEYIIERANAVTDNYDRLINMVYLRNTGSKVNERDLRRELFKTMVSVNVLERVRFYVSFACSFSFAERGLMEGNAKIIKLIARDEALHMSGTQFILNQWMSGRDGDEWMMTASECLDDIVEIFEAAKVQEKAWADYLFKDGSMLGLNDTLVKSYVDYIADVGLKSIGMSPLSDVKSNPFSWMNAWLSNEAVQVAPQEVEVSAYLSGSIDTTEQVNSDDLEM